MLNVSMQKYAHVRDFMLQWLDMTVSDMQHGILKSDNRNCGVEAIIQFLPNYALGFYSELCSDRI